MNLNISSYIRTAKNVITANSPVLLVGTAIVGVVTTGILAAKGGYQARGIVDAERMRRVPSPIGPFDTFDEYYQTYVSNAPELTLAEQAKLTWLCYAVPAVTGAGSIASVLGVHSVHSKRHAALAGLYAVTSNKLDDYREQAEELLGPKKTEQLNGTLAQKSIDRSDQFDHEVILGTGDVLFYDELTGRYFNASVPIVEKALNEVNLAIAEDGKASLSDFYDHIGIKTTALGDQLGWEGTHGFRVQARFDPVLTGDGRTAMSITFREAPKVGFGRH